MAYRFDPRVDPDRPLDKVKNPPPCAKTRGVVDDKENETGRYGKNISPQYHMCFEWEQRELVLWEASRKAV